jgi:hypothetical protein
LATVAWKGTVVSADAAPVNARLSPTTSAGKRTRGRMTERAFDVYVLSIYFSFLLRGFPGIIGGADCKSIARRQTIVQFAGLSCQVSSPQPEIEDGV